MSLAVQAEARGAGGMVSDCLADLLPGLERQLVGWTSALRTCAARTLLAALQLAGASIGDHLAHLLPVLRRARGEIVQASRSPGLQLCYANVSQLQWPCLTFQLGLQGCQACQSACLA